MIFLKYLINHLKKSYKIEQGPEFYEAMRHLNRPSEVTVPNELIPAGVLMHLRGLFNLHALSVNADWIWPYWMERQADPKSDSFVPRAMSFSYINLTHRNWTGVGVLGGTREAVIDPRGLATPWVMGWSLDTWVRDPLAPELVSQRSTGPSGPANPADLSNSPDPNKSISATTAMRLGFVPRHRPELADGWIFPSRLPEGAVHQKLVGNIPIVRTTFAAAGFDIQLDAWAFREGDTDYLVHEARITNSANIARRAELCLSLRPCNPEGFSLINSLAYNTRGFWHIGGQLAAFFPERPTFSAASTHDQGDVVLHLEGPDPDSDEVAETNVTCRIGLATAASVFRITLDAGESATRYAVMPMEPLNPRFFDYQKITTAHLQKRRTDIEESWRAKLAEGTQIHLPDARYQACTDACRATLLLLNDGHEVTAGPMTYHRHWFRDAAYILNALDKIGYASEVRRNLSFIPLKQWKNGYYCSQKGEWDSNGQAMWSIVEHYRLSGDLDSLRELYPSLKKGAIWIDNKRQDVSFNRQKPRGLMPAGFSAEHLGPNDHYYWDNFWALRGMLDATEAALALGQEKEAAALEKRAVAYRRDLEEAINRDLERSPVAALPAAPGRRPDAGMIGNVAAAYPLKLYHPEDMPWLANTIAFIRDHLFHDEGFYQGMIHSGVNSYLTLQVAQCMHLQGDLGAFELCDYMLKIATQTWCWPEAINPRTLGGCMGDGHHGWAAADWVLLMRNIVICEDDDALIITRALPPAWCEPGKRIAIERAPSYFGEVSVAVEFGEGTETLTISANWRRPPRELRWYLPGEGRRVVASEGGEIRLEGRIAILPSTITRVRLELALDAAQQPAPVPGLQEMP